MHPSLFFGVWVFHQNHLRVGSEALNFRQLNVVIYPISVVFQVKAGVLEGARQLND
jgi:hypothetical protein